MTNKFFAGIIAGIFCSCMVSAQTLFTYGTKPVTQKEFVRAFEKNPTPGDRKKAMQEYLPLFINYKLKVQDALDKKMDTLPNQKTELVNYRLQLVESYINNKANTKALVKEAFERSQKDILLGHLFIGFNPKDSSSIKNAYERATLARKALESNRDFASVVKDYSTDESNKASGGRVGWITVFSVPYPFETIIYELPTGGFSQIVRSSTGFHIFKKMDERPAAGTVKVAQIMLVNPEPGNKGKEEKIKKLADSLYTALQKGARFDTLAEQFSNDRTSYSLGGALPEFGVGTYSGSFEDVAFSLAKKGDISKPFSTEYGIHILQLIEKKPVPSNTDDPEFNSSLAEKVNGSGRSKAAKSVYLKSQMQAFRFKAAPVNQQELFRFTDSSLASANTKTMSVNGKTPVFMLGGKTITASDWLNYVKNEKFLQENQNRSYNDLMQSFYLLKTEEYIQKNIESLDPTTSYQLKDFRDANLLFEAMEKNVWNKAAIDSAGQMALYTRNKTKYKWNESALAAMFTCTDSTIVSSVINSLRNDPLNWHHLTETYSRGLFADSGRYEISQLPTGGKQVTAGSVTTPVKNELDGSYSFAVLFKMLPANEQRSFEDARGFVINDYQQELEEKWVSILKKKYPVKINQPVWTKLLATPANVTLK